MQEKNIKRVSLYFNLDNPIENKMWRYLESGRSKSNTIKNLLEDKINGVESPMIKNKIVEKDSEIEKPNENLELALDKDELDMAGMNGF